MHHASPPVLCVCVWVGGCALSKVRSRCRWIWKEKGGSGGACCGEFCRNAITAFARAVPMGEAPSQRSSSVFTGRVWDPFNLLLSPLYRGLLPFLPPCETHPHVPRGCLSRCLPRRPRHPRSPPPQLSWCPWRPRCPWRRWARRRRRRGRLPRRARAGPMKPRRGPLEHVLGQWSHGGGRGAEDRPAHPDCHFLGDIFVDGLPGDYRSVG